jgi:hypothetical protein
MKPEVSPKMAADPDPVLGIAAAARLQGAETKTGCARIGTGLYLQGFAPPSERVNGTSQRFGPSMKIRTEATPR